MPKRIKSGVMSIRSTGRRSLKCLTVPLYVALVANVLTLSRLTTPYSSLLPSSTTVVLVVSVELSTLGRAEGTGGTSSTVSGLLLTSGSSQVILVGAAEAKMAKKVKKRRTATVKVEAERDIVLARGVRSELGRWEPKSSERQDLLYCERQPLAQSFVGHILRMINWE